MPLTTYTAGDVLTAASLNANFTFAAANPTSGLTFINSTTFTTVASVSLPVATFSATHENYLVLINITAASTTITLTGRMRIAGANNTTSNYSTTLSRVKGDNSNSIIGNAAQSSFSLSTTDNTGFYGASLDFISPFSANKTYLLGNIIAVEAGVAVLGLAGGLSFDAATSFDSFSLIANTGTISGTIRVYGYANS